MKRLLVICLTILAVGGLALGAGLYFVYRAATPVMERARDYFESLTQLGELDKRITNQAPFTPPANGELTKEQLDRFARVQADVKRALGRRFEQIEEKYTHLKANAGNELPSMRDVIAAFRELAGVIVDARRFQVDALNRERFSSAEYSWVRTRVYQAAGVNAANVRVLKTIADAARRGTGIESIQAPTIDLNVPQRNRDLVKPHMRHMDDWLPLAFFGL